MNVYLTDIRTKKNVRIVRRSITLKPVLIRVIKRSEGVIPVGEITEHLIPSVLRDKGRKRESRRRLRTGYFIMQYGRGANASRQCHASR